MSKIVHSKDFRPSPQHSYFFDNNVWMFLYCPMGGYAAAEQTAYSNILGQILTVKAQIFINSMILSEFVNTWLRIDHKEWSKEEIKNSRPTDFKGNFVGTKAYKTSVTNVLTAVSAIRKITSPSNDDYNALNIDAILNQLYHRDFNDNYFIALSNKRNWIIVSHDVDLLKCEEHNGIIVTAKKVT